MNPEFLVLVGTTHYHIPLTGSLLAMHVVRVGMMCLQMMVGGGRWVVSGGGQSSWWWWWCGYIL